MFTLAEIEDAQRLVASRMSPTPQYAWPSLEARLGCKVWVKHENHTPTGSFKVRGATNAIEALRPRGVVTGSLGKSSPAAATPNGMQPLDGNISPEMHR